MKKLLFLLLSLLPTLSLSASINIWWRSYYRTGYIIVPKSSYTSTVGGRVATVYLIESANNTLENNQLYDFSGLNNHTQSDNSILSYLSDIAKDITYTDDTQSPTSVGDYDSTMKAKDGSSFLGNTYGVILSVVDDNGVTWYNISGNTYEYGQSGGGNQIITWNYLHDDIVNVNPIESFTDDMVGTGWYRFASSIPEPSTSAIALIGTILLFGNRKHHI